MNVLVLNAGSATLKYKLYALGGDEWVLADGVEDHAGGASIVGAAEQVIAQCRPLGIDAVGHRVVHGGARFSAATLVTPQVLEGLRALRELDPLHNPTEVAMVEAGLRLLPGLPAVAAFDTAFHRRLPEVAWRYALPWDLSDRLGLRRYGFHGLSYQYVSGRLLERLGCGPEGTRLVLCHLGSGASVCAVRDGRSVDTSMGLTPLEGLVMGTRSGDVDPGLLLYLLRAQGMTPAALDGLLNRESGLRGLSGSSADVRELERAAGGGDERAAVALEIFAYRVRKYIGSYAAALGGLDGLGFTGGIGEHSAGMRARVCTGLGFLGVNLEPPRNEAASGEACISEAGGGVPVWVIPTDEEREVAREVVGVLGGGPLTPGPSPKNRRGEREKEGRPPSPQ